MAEKVSKGISSTACCCNSKRSKSRPVRVVHISNPTLIKTNVSEFRAVVQSYTGRKRSSASDIQYEETNLYYDNLYSRQLKVPKLEDGLQNLNDRKISEPALIDDNAAMKNSRSDKDHGDFRIFEDLEALTIQIPNYIPLQHQGFDSVESNIGDARHILFDIFSPSIIFSQVE